ncbi:MAG: SOS response-associated peptidase family protein [Parasporobacterium sp.]|nr:SOS response-associated peptidase family protein [Parasporobacterium sp.]
MCTRFFIDQNLEELSEYLQAVKESPLLRRFEERDPAPFVTSGEVFPTNIAVVLAPGKDGRRSAFPMKWGYRLNKKTTLFNARLETAGEKPTFREDYLRHRCIIPASWYYEWQHRMGPDGTSSETASSRKSAPAAKYKIQPGGQSVTWLAGLYRIENGLPYFVVLTREPSGNLRKIHDRMPLILPEKVLDDWIWPDSDPGKLIKYAVTDLYAKPCG